VLTLAKDSGIPKGIQPNLEVGRWKFGGWESVPEAIIGM
jgi:hypothetical protein